MANKKEDQGDLMDKIISLSKRRGFIFPGSEIYGGLANSWDYGPLGVELKNNIKQAWWERFVHQRDDMVGVDTALIMNPKVWEASGHLKEFSDPLVECKKCHHRFRADQAGKVCADCGGGFTVSKQFNMMFKTFLGPVEDDSSVVYLRPETAQGQLVNFKNVLDATRKKLPFGIAQIGKAFRNEITPGKFIFRTREFEQMEIEYFIREKDAKEYFDMWLDEIKKWLDWIGVSPKKLNFREVPDSERAHYSKRTIDIDYGFPFGKSELYGLAWRTDFDLKNHEKFSGANLKYRDEETGEKFWPHVIEPTWGVDRTLLAMLCESYRAAEGRVCLKIPLELAPFKVAVFPLLANKPDLIDLARKIYDNLRQDFTCAWDDRGDIGKRYYSQDEIGTPFCVTIDFESLADKAVTVRDRDTMKQERVSINNLAEYLRNKLYV